MNESRLHVHVDRSATHVISFILHIDSSDDAEPWPILIEDYQGSESRKYLGSFTWKLFFFLLTSFSLDQPPMR
jgi:hypothetical protein